METILIFAGGPLPSTDLANELPAADLIVAADSGYDTAISLGYTVDVLVGDFDSIRSTPIPDHVITERHPTDKDQTDLDLALELAVREEPARIAVVAGSGGRQDHELATAMLLCSERWRNVEDLDWISERSRAYVVRGRRLLHGDVGSTVSLLPVGGPAEEITTRGLAWELVGDTLRPGSTRGVSNVTTAPVVDVSVETGCLLVVFPTPESA